MKTKIAASIYKKFYRSSGSFSPSSISGLQLGLDSTSGVGLIGVDASTWTDTMSGNGHVATAPSSGTRPFIQPEGLGSANVLEFNGSKYMDIPYASGLNPSEFTLITIKRVFDLSTSIKGVFTNTTNPGISGGVNDHFNPNARRAGFISESTGSSFSYLTLDSGNDFQNNTWVNQATTSEGSSQNIYKDGVIQISTTSKAITYSSNTSIRIGGFYNLTSSLLLVGQLRGILLYSKKLSVNDFLNLNAWISSNWLNQTYENVVWGSLTANLTAYGNTLEITPPGSPTNDWLESAVGSKTLTGDGAIEIIVSSIGGADTEHFIGLTNDNTGNDYHELDFSLQLNVSTLYVWENNNSSVNSGAIVELGDRYGIEIRGTDVIYSLNGTPFHTNSGASITTPLILDTSFNQSNSGQLKDVRLIGPNWS